MLICYTNQLKSHETHDSMNNHQFYSNIQEDLSILLFITLYHQVSCLENYFSQDELVNTQQYKFDLSSNLKEHLLIPFNVNSSLHVNKVQSELKHLEDQQLRAYDVNYKLNLLLKQKMEAFSQEKILNYSDTFATNSSGWSLDVRLKQILDRKFRLYWNFKWHGGTISKLCNDLLYNEQFITQNEANQSFNSLLCLSENDKFLVKYSAPFYLFKQLFSDLNSCQTHNEALNTLDMIQILINLVDNNESSKFDFDLFDLSAEIENQTLHDENDLKFYAKNSLKFYLNRVKCDWHLNLNRFISVMPSTKSKSDQILFSNSVKTVAKMLHLQNKLGKKLDLKSNQAEFVNEEVGEKSTLGCRNLDQSLMNSNNNQLAILSGLMSRIGTKNPIESDKFNSTGGILFLEKWLFGLIYNTSSAFVSFIKHLFNSYESDETNSTTYLLPLCDFIKIYYDRLNKIQNHQVFYDQLKSPSYELLKLCIEQIQACEIDKFRNLNKLAILVNLIGSLLRCTQSQESLFNQDDTNKSFAFSPKTFIQLTKSLVQVFLF
jgi:hypothetical protein